VGVVDGTSDKDYSPTFGIGDEGLLLKLIKAVDLIDKKDGLAGSIIQLFFGLKQDLAYFLGGSKGGVKVSKISVNIIGYYKP